MNTNLVKVVADAIDRSQKNGKRTPTGIAIDLESAQLLMSPEMAAELEGFRSLELAAIDGRVSASCPEPGHSTWLRAKDDVRGCPWCRVAELERLRMLFNAQPASLSEAQIDALGDAGNGAVNDYYHERQCACSEYPEGCATDPQYRRSVGYWDTGAFEIGMAAVIGLWESMRADASAAELGRLKARVAELEAAVGANEPADGIARRIVPVQALREPEHYAATHHTYQVGRDLPSTPTTPTGDPR